MKKPHGFPEVRGKEKKLERKKRWLVASILAIVVFIVFWGFFSILVM